MKLMFKFDNLVLFFFLDNFIVDILFEFLCFFLWLVISSSSLLIWTNSCENYVFICSWCFLVLLLHPVELNHCGIPVLGWSSTHWVLRDKKLNCKFKQENIFKRGRGCYCWCSRQPTMKLIVGKIENIFPHLQNNLAYSWLTTAHKGPCKDMS